jgi:hypothetical protein
VDDYFGNTVSGGYGQGTPPPWGGQPTPPATPSYGGATSGYAELPYAVAAPAHATYQAFPPTAPQRPTQGLTLVGRLGPVLGGLLVLAVLAAVAVPVAVDQRNKGIYRRTTVSLPVSVRGATQMSGGGIETVLAKMTDELPTPGLAAVYGTGYTPRYVVAVAKHRMTRGERKGFWSDAEDGGADGARLTLRKVSPGPLGGDMRCAFPTPRTALCGFVDAGAYGAMMVLDEADAEGAAREIRAALEHRTG